MTTKQQIKSDVQYVADLITIASNPEWIDCPECEDGLSDEHDRCYPPNYYTCKTCNGTGKVNKNADIITRGVAALQARLIAHHAAMAVVVSKHGVKMYQKMLDKFMKDYAK